MRLWDVASRRALGAPLRGHTTFVTSVAFGPARHKLASVGDEDLRIWNPPLVSGTESVTTIRQAFCPLAGRNLSRSEWSEFLSDSGYHKTCPQFPPGP